MSTYYSLLHFGVWHGTFAIRLIAPQPDARAIGIHPAAGALWLCTLLPATVTRAGLGYEYCYKHNIISQVALSTNCVVQSTGNRSDHKKVPTRDSVLLRVLVLCYQPVDGTS